MKIFISWSGPRSGAVASALKSWIKRVLQATEPWISAGDIQRGSAWREELRNQLAVTESGIICITKSNRESPWLLFEAGAIAKLENARTCTLLIDLKNSEVKEPLAMFQSTDTTKDSLRQLAKEFNGRLPEKSRLDDETFSGSFEAHWPAFEEKLSAAIKIREGSDSPPPRRTEDMMEELLTTTRNIERGITAVEVLSNQLGQINQSAGPWFSSNKLTYQPSNDPLHASLFAELTSIGILHGVGIEGMSGRGKQVYLDVRQGTLSAKAKEALQSSAQLHGFDLAFVVRHKQK